MAENEKILHANPLTVREAAEEAACVYPSDRDKQIEAMKVAWAAKLKDQTDKFKSAAILRAREGQKRKPGVAEALTEPTIGIPGAPPYPWWNIVIAGPFQPAPVDPTGPFLANKIFVPDQDAFCFVAVWLNPAPINWFPPGPSAADMMNALNMRINFPIINLVAATPGPPVPFINWSPLNSFGPFPWLKIGVVQLGNNVFPLPGQGNPVLYEMNVTADVTGPAPVPFAGFCTWVFDPDFEPATWPPSVPTVGPHWQFEIPMRFMTYRR